MGTEQPRHYHTFKILDTEEEVALMHWHELRQVGHTHELSALGSAYVKREVEI